MSVLQLEIPGNRFTMFNSRRFHKKGTSKIAPDFERGGLSENDHMMVHAFPLNKEAILCRVFDHMFQAHTMTPLGAPEGGNCLGDSGFEFFRI